MGAMGIASMSEVYDHEPMWAHYADQFAGMCVQYNLARLIKGLDRDIAITRMMYSEREPVALIGGCMVGVGYVVFHWALLFRLMTLW
jgi:hypothetical protein